MVIASLAALWQDQSINPAAGFFSGGCVAGCSGRCRDCHHRHVESIREGRAAGMGRIIPIFNVYILLKIAGRPAWWLMLYFVPIANFVVAIIVAIDVAKAFGQSAVFGFFLLFLFAGIGYLILGFGNYQYRGPATAMAAVA